MILMCVPEDNLQHKLCPHSAATHSTLAVGVVGGLLVAVIVSVVIFVLLRRRRIRRKRTLRRLLQEREVGEAGVDVINRKQFLLIKTYFKIMLWEDSYEVIYCVL